MEEFSCKCVIVVLLAGCEVLPLQIVVYEDYFLILEPFLQPFTEDFESLIMATISCNFLILCSQFEFVSACRELFFAV